MWHWPIFLSAESLIPDSSYHFQRDYLVFKLSLLPGQPYPSVQSTGNNRQRASLCRRLHHWGEGILSTFEADIMDTCQLLGRVLIFSRKPSHPCSFDSISMWPVPLFVCLLGLLQEGNGEMRQWLVVRKGSLAHTDAFFIGLYIAPRARVFGAHSGIQMGQSLYSMGRKSPMIMVIRG